MKLLPAVVGLSVGLNAALVAAFISRPALAPTSVRGLFERVNPGGAPDAAASKISSSSSAKAKSPAVSVDLWAQLKHDDLPALVARLRAAGFPPGMIRAIAEAEIMQRFSPRLQELRRVLDETPYWRGDGVLGNNKLYEQMSQLSRERGKALRELLGQDAFAYAGVDPTEAQRQRFGNLSPGKIELVQRITDDYAEMQSQIRASMQGISLPEDKEKFALLEREKRADLASILTPAELADYEMRTSQTTMRLRTAFTIMDASQDEFRAIYAAHVPHQETLYPTTTGITYFISSDMNDSRSKATQQVNEQIKQSLGPDRYAQYLRAADREFQQLYQLSRTDNVPYDTLVRAYDSRQSASEASVKIANDTALTLDQRREALKQLAQQTRTQLLSTLGATTGPGYAQAARWLTGLEQGRPFTVAPDGGIRSVPIAMPRPAPTPKQ